MKIIRDHLGVWQGGTLADGRVARMWLGEPLRPEAGGEIEGSVVERASRRRGGPTTWMRSRCPCSSSAGRATSSRTWICSGRPADGSAAARRLYAVEMADHGSKIIGRSRTGGEDVIAEMARVVLAWASGLE